MKETGDKTTKFTQLRQMKEALWHLDTIKIHTPYFVSDTDEAMMVLLLCIKSYVHDLVIHLNLNFRAVSSRYHIRSPTDWNLNIHDLFPFNIDQPT